MIEPFERTIYIGNEAGLQEHHITVEIKFDGKRLSITGDISNRSKTQLYECGQINMSIDPKKINYADPWNEIRFTHFLAIWNRWHLNDMRAGCEHQERDWDKNKEKNTIHYINKTSGLPSDQVVSLIEDDNGDIWAGTRNGLACIYPYLNEDNKEYEYTIASFDESDGLVGTIFNQNAVFKNQNVS